MEYESTGGPAFPVSPNKNDPSWAAARDGGMTLRDYFAAKAMQGLCATITGSAIPDWQLLAADAYSLADAMLEARK